MILFFYNLALVSGLVASAPWWLWRMATTNKYREGLPQRLGKVPPWLKSAAGGRPAIWLHAVSVGEVLAVTHLVSEIERLFPKLPVLVSTTTRTGQALARERFGANRVFYCPLDLPWAVRAYVDAIHPRMLILAETEFWPNLLSNCFRRGIPVVVVNGRISDRSWPRYRMLWRLWQPILSKVSRALAQSETDAERLKAIGVEPDRVIVTGNLKFDVRATRQAEATRLLLLLARNLRLIVAGSTLDGEEEALLEIWPALSRSIPQLAMVIAPRHPERFDTVAALLKGSGVAWVKRSSWNGRAFEDLRSIAARQVVLLDTIGELASLYSLASVAFVGGSIVPAGGHNPLEPAQFGVPIVIGDHYANFRGITDALRARQAISITTKDELSRALRELLTDQEKASGMGRRAKRVFDEHSGATDKTVRAIQDVLRQEERER
jgi:3-deoxy-D-manno-octulosonic-acid transferase